MAVTDKPAECQLCERELHLTFHHLIPRKVQRRTRFQKHYSKEQLALGIWVCRPCHNAIHRFHDEMTLGQAFNTLEKLLDCEKLQKHIGWVKKQKRQ